MNQLNSLIIEGNLARDGELKEVVKGFNVCNLSIGVNRTHRNSDGECTEEVSFFDVECYGKMAEFAVKDAKKGRGIRIVGRLKQNTWKDADGKNHSKVFIIAEHIDFKPMRKTERQEQSA